MRFFIILVIGFISASGMVYYLFELNVIDYLPAFSLCPFHAITSIPCPGCGMTRAFICLGQLEFVKAFQYNPFSIPLMLVMILYLFPGRIPSRLNNEILIRCSLLIVVTVWLLRLI